MDAQNSTLDELAQAVTAHLATASPFFKVGTFERTGEFGTVTLPGKAVASVEGRRITVTVENPLSGCKYEFFADLKVVLRD